MIRKVKWNNYRQLGDLSLDFTKNDDSIYKTIVLAGENGTGKTTILETLSTFLNLGSINQFNEIECEVNGCLFGLTPDPNLGNLGFHTRTNLEDNSSTTIRTNSASDYEQLKKDDFDIRKYGCSYSKARSGFATKPIQSSTTQQLDSNNHDNDESDDYTSIKQLLVDIDEQDAKAFREIGRNKNVAFYNEFLPNSKIERFRSAFNNFFDHVQFDRVNDESPDEKEIIFTKYGNQITIDDLSTGEKQIVFRGAQLLKNSGALSQGIVLIDEPELSMHPKWQKKILSYYQGLFMHYGQQDVQLIVATHSEYVVSSALEDTDDTLVIVLTDENGQLQEKPITAPFVLPTITSAETNYIAFGVPSKDYLLQLYACIQDNNELSSVAECDKYIENSPYYDATDHERLSCFGNTQYKTLPAYIRNAIAHPDNGNKFNDDELKTAIELLIKICSGN